MRRLPPHLAPLGYSPRRYLPLSPAPVLGMGERLTDFREMQLLFANGELGGYWPADPAYAYEDSAGTTLASVNGVVGYRTDVALGKHAVQATTANKSYLRRTPTTGKYWYDSNTATGALNVTFASALGRRNLLTYTEDFSNAVWVLNTGSVVIAQNSVVSPDGLTSGIKVTETTTAGEHFFEQLIAVNTNQSYSSSIYVKAGNTTGFNISVVAVGSSDTLSYASFTIAAGVISVGSNTGIITSSSATLIGDGWYRCLVIYTLNGTVTSHRQRIHPKNTGNYTGDGVSYLYIWHPQLETGTTPTDYQKIVAGPSSALDPTALSATYSKNISATTNCTVACVTPEGVVIADNQTVGTTYNICPPYGYNSDVLIINRALTPAERALVTRVMQRSVPTLGSELVDNGAFDTNINGWTNIAPTRGTVSWDNGRAKIDGTGGNGSSPAMATTVLTNNGACYLITADFSTQDGSIGYSALGGITIYSPSLISNGTYKSVIKKSNSDLSMSLYGTGLKISYFDNASCREIL